MREGLSKAAKLAPGRGYLEAMGGLRTAGGIQWRAQAETGWHIAKGHTVFGQAYVQPGDAGVMGGYRFEF